MGWDGGLNSTKWVKKQQDAGLKDENNKETV